MTPTIIVLIFFCALEICMHNSQSTDGSFEKKENLFHSTSNNKCTSEIACPSNNHRCLDPSKVNDKYLVIQNKNQYPIDGEACENNVEEGKGAQAVMQLCTATNYPSNCGFQKNNWVAIGRNIWFRCQHENHNLIWRIPLCTTERSNNRHYDGGHAVIFLACEAHGIRVAFQHCGRPFGVGKIGSEHLDRYYECGSESVGGSCSPDKIGQFEAKPEWLNSQSLDGSFEKKENLFHSTENNKCTSEIACPSNNHRCLDPSKVNDKYLVIQNKNQYPIDGETCENDVKEGKGAQAVMKLCTATNYPSNCGFQKDNWVAVGRDIWFRCQHEMHNLKWRIPLCTTARKSNSRRYDGGHAVIFLGCEADGIQAAFQYCGRPLGIGKIKSQHLDRYYECGSEKVGSNCSPDKIGQFEAKPEWLPADTFAVIMSADTQYPWTEDPPYKGDQEKEESAKLIKNYFTSMAKLKGTYDTANSKIAAMFINGDLTAFGHGNELDRFKELLEAGQEELDKVAGHKFPIYLGLGNHDYANNVDDCFSNNCAQRMYDYMARQDYAGMDKHVEIGPRFGTLSGVSGSDTYEGSLSYSVDIENVHFVQLHNYPTYTTKWNVIYPFSPVENYEVKSSLDWLEKDLEKAHSSNKFIILGFHDCCDHFKEDKNSLRFKDMITRYNVSAIFVGHFHSQIGKYSKWWAPQTIYGNVPVFASGSAVYSTYTLVEFNLTAKKFDLSVYDSQNGNAIRRMHVPTLQQSTYDLK